MRLTYETHGTCSKYIDLEIDEQGVLQDVYFTGGCSGNTQGICALVKGMKADEVKKRLRGILCHDKGTSCPDQLARAIESMGI